MVTPSGTVVLYPIDAPPIDGAPGPIDAITTTFAAVPAPPEGYNPPVILKAPDLKHKTGRTWSGPCERSMPLLLSRRVVFSSQNGRYKHGRRKQALRKDLRI